MMFNISPCNPLPFNRFETPQDTRATQTIQSKISSGNDLSLASAFKTNPRKLKQTNTTRSFLNPTGSALIALNPYYPKMNGKTLCKVKESFWILPQFGLIGLLMVYSDIIIITPAFRFYEIERYLMFRIFSATYMMTMLISCVVGYVADKIGSNYLPRLLVGINGVSLVLCITLIVMDVATKKYIEIEKVEINASAKGIAFSKTGESLVILIQIL